MCKHMLAGIKSRLKKALQGVILAEQLLKQTKGAKVRVVLIRTARFFLNAYAQSGKNWLVFETIALTYLYKCFQRQYVCTSGKWSGKGSHK